MPTKPVQVSIDVDLLRQVDADPESQSRGRSAFFRSALRLYLQAKRRRSIDQAIRTAYDGKANELLAEIEDLLEVQSWPER